MDENKADRTADGGHRADAAQWTGEPLGCGAEHIVDQIHTRHHQALRSARPRFRRFRGLVRSLPHFCGGAYGKAPFGANRPHAGAERA